MKKSNKSQPITTFSGLSELRNELCKQENVASRPEMVQMSNEILEKVQDFNRKHGNCIGFHFNKELFPDRIITNLIICSELRYRIAYYPELKFAVRISSKKIVSLNIMFKIINSILLKKQKSNAKITN